MFFKRIKSVLKSRKIVFVLVLIIILILIASSFFLFNFYNSSDEVKYGEFSDINKDDKILIFSPHPDDETLVTGGLIQKAKEKNASVLVVSITDGSASTNKTHYEYFLSQRKIKTDETLPEMRYRELNEAIDQLGLNQFELVYLGYPDTGLFNMFETNWDTPYNTETDFNHFNQSHYNFSYIKNQSYAGKNLNNDIKNIINDFQPTIVVYPDSKDILPDHFTTNAFVSQALIETNYSGLNYTYLVHTDHPWSKLNFYFPWMKMEPPLFLLDSDTKWISLNLGPQELAIKGNALNNHKSQLFESSNFLLSFLKTNELFMEHSPTIIANYSNFSKEEASNLLFSNEVNNINNTSNINNINNDKNINNTNHIINILEMPMDEKQMSKNKGELGVFHDKNHLNVVLKSSEEINDNSTYYLNIRKFNDINFSRIDIKVKNNTIIYESIENNNVVNQKIDVYTLNDTITISIPLDLFEGDNAIMISSKTLTNHNRTVDEIKWESAFFS
jgi:LmbE family N-acetylglucosaminyl deacetylase